MMKAQGEKMRSWDEVNGQDEKTAPPDQSPLEAIEGPMRAYVRAGKLPESRRGAVGG